MVQRNGNIEPVLSEHAQLVEELHRLQITCEAIADGQVGLAKILTSLTETVARIGEKIASSGSLSSTEIKTSTRGHDVTVKVYEGSDVRLTVDDAVTEYQRAVAMLAASTADSQVR